MNRITKHTPCLVMLLCAHSATTIAHAYDPTLVYPVSVQQHTKRVHINGSPFWGPNNWGFDMATELLVYDNKGGHWGKGDIQETFSSLSIKPAWPDTSFSTGALNDYGKNSWWNSESGLVGGVFIDRNFATPPGPLKSSTANTGNDQWFTVNQHFHAYYGTGTTYLNKYKYGWNLGPTMALDYRQTYYTRSPGY